MDCRVALLLAVTRKWRPRSDEGAAVSESLSSVSDTIFNLDIIHRTDMQGNISARQQTEEKLWRYASVFSHDREGIMITDIEGTILDIAMWRDLIQTGHWSNEIWNKRKSGEVYPQLLTISAAPDAQGIVWTRWYALVATSLL